MDPSPGAGGAIGVSDGDEAVTLAPYSCTTEEKTVSLDKDCVVLVRKVLDSGWVYVVAVSDDSKAGYFPGAYLKKLDKSAAAAAPAPAAALPEPISPKRSLSKSPISSQKDASKAQPPPPLSSSQALGSGSPSQSVSFSSSGSSPISTQKSTGSRTNRVVMSEMKASTGPMLNPSSALSNSDKRKSSSLPDIDATGQGMGSLAEYVGDANNKFQDYVLFQSRLVNKYKASLEAQTNLMDANNDLAICIHEFGKKLAATDDGGDATLGSCMMKISEIVMAQERLKSQQRAAEQEMVQHFLDFVNISAPDIRTQKNKFDVAQQEYLDASLRLREMGMKSKVKLENVKQAEGEKAEKKTNYHNLTVSLLDTLKTSVHGENAALLSLFIKWVESLNDATQISNRNLHRDMTSVKTWQETIKSEEQRKEEQKIKSEELLQTLNSDSDASAMVLLGTKASTMSMKVTQDPVQKLLDRLIRSEKKFVHGIAATQNLYLAEFKKEAGLLTAEDEKKIFINIGDIIEFHQRLLKALEKAYNCWPFPHLAGLFLDLFKTDVFWMYGDYLCNIGSSRSTLKKLGHKKEQWKALNKSIQQRHDIGALSELLALPQHRLGVYIKFFEDYLEAIPESEPDYNPALDTIQHFEECSEDILDNAGATMKGELEKFGSVISGIDLCNEDEVRYTKRSYVHRGSVDVKSSSDPKYSANYLLLCTDQLVCCQKEAKSQIKFINSLFLFDMEVKNSPNDNLKFTLHTSSGEFACTVQEQKEKKHWTFHLNRLIENRIRRFKVFGVPLKVLIRREKERTIPSFMKDAITVILRHKQSEGIFRLSGEKRIIKQAIFSLNQGKPAPFAQVDEHSVAGVLKQFFRELPEPLLTWGLYDEFVNCIRSSDDSAKRAAALGDVVEQLPRANRLVLMFLCKLLHDVALDDKVNKMGPRNLSIVFGPNLLRTYQDSEGLSDFPAKVVEVMIEKFSTVFAQAEREFEVKFERTSYVDQGRQVRLNDYRRSFRSQRDTYEEGEETEDDDEEGEGVLEENQSATLGTIVKEGWLSKKGEMRRNWTRRWFVLKYGSLAYFKTQDGVHAAGRIILVDCLVGQSTSKKANCFAITTPSKRTFLLTAANPREQAEWMQAIQGCIETSF